MKLTKLILQGFGSHRHTQVEFSQPCSLIVGSLGVGKSTLGQAVEYALFGTVERYRKRGDPIDEVMHEGNGTERFDVLMATDAGTAKRGRSKAASYVKWEDLSGTEAEHAMFSALGTNREVAAAILGTSDFFDRDPKEQREIILALLGAEVTTEKIAKAFAERHPDADGALALIPITAGDINSVAAIDSAYKIVYDERTATNRELKNAKPQDPPEGARPPIDRIQSQLAELRESKEAKVEERGRYVGVTAAERTANLQTQKNQLQTEIKGIQEWAKGRKDPKAELDTLKAAMPTYEQAIGLARGRQDTTEQEYTRTQASVLAHRRNVDLLRKFSGTCVAGPHACPATKLEMNTALGIEDTECKGAEAKATQLGHDVATCREAVRIAEGALLEAKQNLQRLEREAETWVDKKKQADSVRKRIESIDRMLAEPAQENPQDAKRAELDQEIARLAERIGAGENALARATEWIAREDLAAKVAERRKRLEERAHRLEALCEFFGPHGIKAELVDQRIGDLEKAINGYMQAFGFELAIQADPWKITAKSRSIARLSRSERFRASVAFQVALAQWSGFGFVVVDNAEILIPAARQQMIKMLLGSGVQSLVINTLMIPEKDFKAPKVAGLDTLMVRNVDGVSGVARL